MSGGILLTAAGSGCGKTTITIALLRALSNRGLKVASFKCGPDYIDPMYHRKTLGIPAYNLDPFFCEGYELCEILNRGMTGRDVAVIEGVMGYYDGYGSEGKASTWEVADKTGTPAILIVNAKGMSNSVGAVLRGFTSYKNDHHIKGVIFNNISKGMYPVFSQIAEKEGLIPLGFMPHNPEVALESRHLGLVTADELSDIQKKLAALGEMAEENLDIDRILEVSNEARELQKDSCEIEFFGHQIEGKKVKLAVAKDDAFCFIYQENVDILEELGCEIVYFSPLADEKVPEGCKGLYLPGGYPELYVDKLSKNYNSMESIKEAINSGMPTIAECGGFMYLNEQIEGIAMAGIIKGQTVKKERLVRFGYGTMKAKEDGMLFKKNESIKVHEFHYYDSENNGADFEITKASNNTKYECAYNLPTMYAGYPHLYFIANRKIAENFVSAMKKD